MIAALRRGRRHGINFEVTTDEYIDTAELIGNF